VQHEDQHQHDADMRPAQGRGRHDVVGGPQVEERAGHRDAGGDPGNPAAQPVGGAFLLLDELLRLLERFLVDGLDRLALVHPGSDLFLLQAAEARASLHILDTRAALA
jgi:hypothetical protein